MTVYVLLRNVYEESYVRGVFSTLEAAQAAPRARLEWKAPTFPELGDSPTWEAEHPDRHHRWSVIEEEVKA